MPGQIHILPRTVLPIVISRKSMLRFQRRAIAAEQQAKEDREEYHLCEGKTKVRHIQRATDLAECISNFKCGPEQRRERSSFPPVPVSGRKTKETPFLGLTKVRDVSTGFERRSINLGMKCHVGGKRAE